MRLPSTIPPRRVLIVSPSFPPMNAPDLQRARMSLPYYRDYGWEPVVLTVDPEEQDGSREEALCSTIPADLQVHRCGAVPLKWSRRLGLGNLGLRAWLHLLRAGAKIIRREKIDLVFLTNTQFVTFLLGRIWLRWLGVPYVIDLQDPWRTDYYERHDSRRPPGGWKYQLARFQAWLFEEWAFRRMGGLMSVSQHYLDDLTKRYPWFSHVPTAVIRFGASETDLTAARALVVPSPFPSAPPGTLRFVYTGAAGPIMPHTLKVLFGGLSLFRQREPERAAQLQFYFLGTSYAPPGQGVATVRPIAAEFGLADQVTEVPHRLGHLECLKLQAEADVLLLLGSSDLAYSPSKIYPYFLSERPQLAVVFKKSYLEEIIEELSCAYTVAFEERTEKNTAHEQLCVFFKLALAEFPAGALPERNRKLFEQEFLARTLTGRQCELFTRAMISSPSVPL